MLKMMSIDMVIVYMMYRWCVDNSYTPCILVAQHNNLVALNIGLEATRNFRITREGLSFTTSFHGHSRRMFVLFDQLVAVYALETGDGILLYGLCMPMANYSNTKAECCIIDWPD